MKSSDRLFPLLVVGFVMFLVAAGSPVVGANPSGPAEAMVSLDLKAAIGPVNRLSIGNNALGYLHTDLRYSAQGAGLWDPVGRRPVPEMLEVIRNTGPGSLRWPGGCGAHLFNWKQAVGPVESRPRQPFGLAEFLQVAEKTGAVPVITLADYWGDEGDFADLVEYLNVPVGVNPNGGIDWAAVRAKQGHAAPYDVRWFEFGNETEHGGHDLNAPQTGFRWQPEQYAKRFRATQAAMKKIDPAVQIGAVLGVTETSFPLSRWSEVVIKETGDVADFFIYHAYLPRYSGNDGLPDSKTLYEIAFASSEQFDVFLDRLNGEVKRVTGRSVPVAVTEFNGSYTQEKPKPYRLGLGTAVQVADMLMLFQKPRLGIVFANYWQMTNEYWGMVKGYQPPYLKRPAYHVFSLLNQHLGDQLVKVDVQSDAYQTKGGFGVWPTAKTAARFEWGKAEKVVAPWKLGFALGANAGVSDSGVLAVDLPENLDLNYHHARIRLPAGPGMGFRVTAEVRTSGLIKSGAQLEIIDDRGWRATRSSSLSTLIRSETWIPVSVDYVTLPDAKGIEISARRLGGKAEGGRMEFRNLRVQRFTPDRLAGVPYLSAMATKGKGKVSLFLVNRNVDAPLKVRIDGIPVGADEGVTLSGPSVDSDNEDRVDEIIPKPLRVDRRADGISVLLPPHSFSVVTTQTERR